MRIGHLRSLDAQYREQKGMQMSNKQAIAGGLAFGAAVASHAANVHAGNLFGTTSTVVGIMVGLMLVVVGWLWTQLQGG